MKKITSILTLVLTLNVGISFESPSIAQQFVWGYQLEDIPCSRWWAIYRKHCMPTSGGFCQAITQTDCPGPPYIAGG
jgi:hypothetical protein